MNILFLAVSPFGGGGVGRVTETLTTEFQVRGHRCIYLATCKGQPYAVNDAVQLFTPSDAIASRHNVEYLQRLVQERNIDVIMNQAGPNPEVLDLIRPVSDRCRVFTVHHSCVACLQDVHGSIIEHTLDGYGVPRFLRWRPLYALLKLRSRLRTGHGFERVVRENASLVLLSSHFIRELRAFSKRIDERKVIAIPNPAPFSAASSALVEKENALLFVGRLANGEKRVDRILSLWRHISSEYPDWRLDIVGDGPDRGSLEEEAQNMDLQRIVFHGRQDPVPFYRKARFLLLTSAFEGFGMVLVEAQAFGCVPIAFECSDSIRDIIMDGETGWIVRPADVEQFTETLRKAMQNPENTAVMAQKALEQNTRFSPAGIVDQWEAAFSQPD